VYHAFPFHAERTVPLARFILFYFYRCKMSNKLVRVPQGVVLRALDRLRLQVGYLDLEYNLGLGGHSDDTVAALEKAASVPSLFPGENEKGDDASASNASHGLDVRGPRTVAMPPLSRLGLALPSENRLIWLTNGNEDWGKEEIVDVPGEDKYVREAFAGFVQETAQEVAVGVTHGGTDSPARLFLEPACLDRYNSLQGKQKKKLQGYWGRDIAHAKQAWCGLREPYTGSVQLRGVGFRVEDMKNGVLRFNLGFANLVDFSLKPEWEKDITLTVKNPIEVEVSGPCKRTVGNVLASMERLRKPDVYKLKGVNIVGKEYRQKAIK